MNPADDPYAQALLAVHKSLSDEIGILRCAITLDALRSGRHSHESLADLFEEVGSMTPTYSGSITENWVKMLREGKAPRPTFTVIEGGKSED